MVFHSLGEFVLASLIEVSKYSFFSLVAKLLTLVYLFF